MAGGGSQDLGKSFVEGIFPDQGYGIDPGVDGALAPSNAVGKGAGVFTRSLQAFPKIRFIPVSPSAMTEPKPFRKAV